MDEKIRSSSFENNDTKGIDTPVEETGAQMLMAAEMYDFDELTLLPGFTEQCNPI